MTQEELKGWRPRGRSLYRFRSCSVCRRCVTRGHEFICEKEGERVRWAVLCGACNWYWEVLNRDYLVALELMK